MMQVKCPSSLESWENDDCHAAANKRSYMLDLPNNPLSNILQFLTEEEGTCALITCQQFYRNVLPLFELSIPTKDQLKMSDETSSKSRPNNNNGGQAECHSCSKLKIQKRRHLFIQIPIQDPSVLLNRFNTKQLYRRNQWANKMKKQHSSNHDDNNNNKGVIMTTTTTSTSTGHNERTTRRRTPYRLGMTTNQLVEYEHTLVGLLAQTTNNVVESTNNDDEYWKHFLMEELPSKYELRRFRRDANEVLPYSNSSLPSTTTLLTSYPRSGNSLLRSLFEKMTGIVSGTDTRPNRTLSKELSEQHDMVGEGVISSRDVHLVKTHFPERKGYQVLRDIEKIILLVRNPYDAIDSYYHMSLTNTHTQSLADDIAYGGQDPMLQDFFHNLSVEELNTWNTFHQYWFHKSSICQKPMIVIRYEDLLLRPHECMARLIAFMINQPLLTPYDKLPSFWKQRLFHVLGPSPAQQIRSNPSSVKSTNEDEDDPKERSNNNHNTPTSAATTKSNNGVSLLLRLGSYQPRTSGIEEDFDVADADADNDDGGSSRQSSKSQSSATAAATDKTKLMIGKSIRRKHFSKDLLQKMHAGLVETINNEQQQNNSSSMVQLFQYDALEQNFPYSFDTKQHVLPRRQNVILNSNGSATSTIKIKKELNVNIGSELRPQDSIYGRSITTWRKTFLTQNDSKPLPTKRSKS